MKRLLVLVDSRRYIRDNCYQSQLMVTLQSNFEVRMLSVREIKFLPIVNVKSYDAVLSVLRMRTLVGLLEPLSRLLKDEPLHVYDQDPWQAYMDASPYRGAYQKLAQKLNLSAILLTTRWWTEFVSAKGLPAKFVRMGMLPDYCNAGPTWERRDIALGFQGTLHPHRKTFYEQLATLGLSVTVLPSASYENYLEVLHRMRIYVHTEDSHWTVEGKSIPRNALWIKETEVAARGTFAIRDYETEAEAYDIGELPTIFPYRTIEEVPEIVATIESMDPTERQDRMRESAETMHRRNDWMTVVRAINT